MRILITGSAGFIGRKLAADLIRNPVLKDGEGRQQRITDLILVDVMPTPQPTVPRGGGDAPRVAVVTGGLAEAADLVRRPDAPVHGVFHLAAVVSSGAEEDFDLGYRVNLDGTRGLLEACRGLDDPPKFVFASSVAVFGGVMPDVIRDETVATPQTSYGTQKLIGELLVNDFSRKGMVDGRSLRLPTVMVRPGKPNKAASTFASSIIREPLQGQRAVCPVPDDTGLWVLSPRRVVAAMRHAFDLPAGRLLAAGGRTVNLAGLTVSVADVVEAVRKAGGADAAGLIDFVPDERIQAIVRTWPVRFAPDRALALGFVPDDSLEAIIAAFVEDDLNAE